MRRVILLLLALAAAQATPAVAQPANFYEVEAELMCDTCNVPLNIAESSRADQQRAQIRRLIAQGKSKEEILDVFVAEYGPNVLADPSKAGGSPAVWLVPAILVLGGALSLVLLLPRWRRRRAASADGPAATERPLTQDDEERLRRDLARYDL